MKLETVLIDRDGVAVRINKTDFNEKEHKLFSEKKAPAKKKASKKKAD